GGGWGWVGGGGERGEGGGGVGGQGQQGPGWGGAGGGGEGGGGRDDWGGMSAGDDRLCNTDEDGEQQRADKEIRGNDEDSAGLADSTQVHQREQHENAEAQREGVRLEIRDRRHQRTGPGGDPDRGGENGVEHEGGGSEQAGKGAEILRGNRIGAAAARIGSNGLAIGKINNREQRDDAGADRYDVGDTCESQRNQERESGFGTVGSGAEGVEPEDWNSGRHSYLFATFVGRGDGFAEQDVENRHHAACPRDIGSAVETLRSCKRSFVTRTSKQGERNDVASD